MYYKVGLIKKTGRSKQERVHKTRMYSNILEAVQIIVAKIRADFLNRLMIRKAYEQLSRLRFLGL